uniref:Catalase n=1 Tax=Philasterides dicentrarchi TaxID=282688 RepID=A0A481SBQ8_9CILI|nr:catalase [Philasterides dicentrarchi]
MSSKPVTQTQLTTSWGAPVDDDQNSMTASEFGPIVLQDTHLIDKLAHFNRERIPERVVHAKGAGAWGHFEVTHEVSKYTKAKFLDTVGKRTPIFVRFSTVAGEKGSADAERDPRGFAIKFYTEEGNYDLVGNNTPVFFIRDPSKFPDFIHSQKRDPVTNCKNPDSFWDFLSQNPESCHQTTILFGDRGIPATFRNMNGYSSHTFKWVNEVGDQFWVKVHIKTDEGIKNLSVEEAAQIKSVNPDHATQDLFETLQKGNTVNWTFNVQIMPHDDAYKYKWNVFDVTKIWPQSDYPLIKVGKLTLNRNPENYFADVEQAAFSPGHLVPGIEASQDKMLQGRLFAYPDTHRHRLGVNYQQIPVNCPYRARLSNVHRDGQSNVNGNQGGRTNFNPSSVHQYATTENAKISKLRISGLVGRFPAGHPNCDFSQAGNLYRKVMGPEERQRLIQNVANHMKNSRRDLQEAQTKIFFKCDAEFGQQLGKVLGFPARKSHL